MIQGIRFLRALQAGALATAVAACMLPGCGEGSSAPAGPPEAAASLAALRTGEPDQREQAVAKLATIKHEAVRHALLTAAHKDIRLQVRVAAVRALVSQDKPTASEAQRLIALLTDKNEEVRAAACDTLGRLAPEGAADALVERLKDPSPGVRVAALASLTRLGPGAGDRLAGVFAEGDAQVRAAVAQALADAGDTSRVPLLIPALQGDDEYLRRVTAEALGKLADERAVEPLVSLARSPLPKSRIEAFEATLSRGPTTRDLTRIADALNKDEIARGFRSNAVAAHLKTSDDRVIGKFRSLVHRDRLLAEAMVRDAALGAIAQIARAGGASAAPALLSLMAADEARLADAAKAAVDSVGPPLTPALVRLLSDKTAPSGARLRAAAILRVRDDAGAKAAIAAALGDPDEALRAYAALHSATKKSADAREPLLTLLGAENAATRQKAAESLAAYPGEATATALVNALGSEQDGGARKAMIRTLGSLREPRATAPLLKIVEKANDPARGDALNALAAIGDPAGGPPLLALLKREPEGWGRGQLITAVGAAKCREAIPLLLAEIRGTQRGARVPQALTALGDIGDASVVPAIAETLRRPVRLNKVGIYEEGAAGIAALEKLRDPRAVDILVYLVRVEDTAGATNRAAAEALGKLDHADARAALVSLLADRDLPSAVRESAVAPALVASGEAAVAPLVKLLVETPAADPKAPMDPGHLAAQVLGHMGKAALPALESVVKQKPARNVAGRVIEALHPIEDDRAVAALATYLKDADPTVRQWAAVALGKSKQKPALAALQSASADADPQVRHWVEESLKRLTAPQ